MDGRDFGSQMCDILGIDPTGLKWIGLNVEPGESVTVVTERIVTPEQGEQLLAEMAVYDVVFCERSEADL